MTKHEIANLMGDGSVDAGFTWELGEVSYEPTKGQKVSLGDAPHAKVEDVAKFEDNFPGIILAALNGTSIKVACQAVTRRAILRNRQVTETELRSLVLNNLRGIKNRAAVVVKREIKAFGRIFASDEEYMTFGLELLTSKGLDEETAREILAGAAEVIETEVTE